MIEQSVKEPIALSSGRTLQLRRPTLWIRILIGATLLAFAWYLAPRPLTTLMVLSIALGLAIVAAGIWSFAYWRSVWGATVGLVLVVSGAAVAWWWGPVSMALPLVLSFAFALPSVRWLISSIRSRNLAQIFSSAMALLSAVAALIIATSWPDVAAILTAWTFVAGTVLLATWLLLPTFRATTRRALIAVTLTVTLGGLSTLIIVGVSLDSKQPTADAFYTWDGDIPSEPGALLRTDTYQGATPAGTDAFRILYTTTDINDDVRLASAVVAIPTTESNEPRTVLAWQHGTTGVTTACAPSLSEDALSEVAIPGISKAIDRDWIVVATDYPGQGTTGPYPYLVGVGEGRSTLDAIRAVQQVEGSNASNRVMLWGHSQGGHATLWAGELANTYAPELEIAGVAALSAASDPYALARDLEAKQPSAAVSLIFSYVLVPYSDAYQDVSLNDSVHPAGHPFVLSAASRCATSQSSLITIIASMMLLKDSPLYVLNLEESPEASRLRENISTADFPYPLLLAQGVADEVIPIDIQRSLAKQVCVSERSVTVLEYPEKTHMGVIAPGAPLVEDLYEWADKVLGGDAPIGCN